MIEFYGVSKEYQERRVLKNLSFKVEQGEFVFLTGPSGSGKTTLLTLIAGLRDVQEGQLFVLGHELHGAARELRDRRRSAVHRLQPR